VIRTALSTAVLVGAILLPFVPGSYDPLATTLSAAATAMAFGSLLLVPIGVVWLIFSRAGYVPSKLALIVAAVVALGVALAIAAGDHSLSAAAAVLVAAMTCAARLWRRVHVAQANGVSLPRTVPMALITVPLTVVAATMTLAEPAAAWSRNRVIANATAIIADIERFRERTGSYPVALSALHPDYLPGTMGVERYRYEPSGQTYNVYFEHSATSPGVQEIVMYNPRREQDISSHTIDLLQLSAEDIRRQRGYFAAHDLERAGWRRFLFD
jgi:hypothetical protein